MNIKGKLIDEETRCLHYHSSLDIIAIKFKCCQQYYPCYQCHSEEAGHSALVWDKSEYDTMAVYCGACKKEMTISAYMESGHQCPYCNAPFNPGCAKHYHLYFE